MVLKNILSLLSGIIKIVISKGEQEGLNLVSTYREIKLCTDGDRVVEDEDFR